MKNKRSPSKSPSTTPQGRGSYIGGRTPRERIEKVVDYYLSMEAPSYQGALIKGGGYSRMTARQGGAAWFKRPDVRAILEEKQAILREKSGVTTELLIDRLKFIAFGDLSKFIKVTPDGGLDYDFSTATPEELKVVNELSVDSYADGRGPNKRTVKKFKFNKADALRAIELLGRMLGSFKDSMEVKGEVSLVERLQRGRAQIRDGSRPPKDKVSETEEESGHGSS